MRHPLRTLKEAIGARNVHTELTKNSYRSDVIGRAEISGIADETPTIKSFDLLLKSVHSFVDPEILDRNRGQFGSLPLERFKFKPGQWVDFFRPGIKQVGGFSITTTPRILETQRQIGLAIKASVKSEIVKWLHHKSRIGDVVYIRTGGEFVLHGSTRRALFIAGGVGITPLYSMMRHISQVNSFCNTKDRIKSHLVYSVRDESEILFKKNLGSIPGLTLDIVVTRDVVSPLHGRVTDTKIQEAIQKLDPQQQGVDVYLCGPPVYEDHVLGVLNEIKWSPVRIFHEKWW